jgi:hypothetical protein
MLASLGSTADYEADQRRIAARREREKGRRAKLLDSKQRTISFAAEENKKLVLEKRRKKKAEALAEKRELELKKAAQAKMTQIEIEQANDKRAKQRELVLWWQQQKNSHMRSVLNKDWDIQDPALLKKDRPPRWDDAGTGLGVSSMQKFAGEDLHSKERKHKVEMMIRRDLEWQVGRKRRAEEEKVREKREAATLLVAQVKQIEAIEAEELRKQRAERVRNAEFNRSQHYRKKLEKTQLLKESDSLSQLEIQYQKRSGFTNQASGGHEKGMSATEIQRIYEEQERQRAARARRRQRDRLEDEEYAEMIQASIRQCDKIDLEMRKEKAEKERAHYTDLYVQKQQDGTRARYVTAESKKNGFDENYYNKFNTGGR